MSACDHRMRNDAISAHVKTEQSQMFQPISRIQRYDAFEHWKWNTPGKQILRIALVQYGLVQLRNGALGEALLARQRGHLAGAPRRGHCELNALNKAPLHWHCESRTESATIRLALLLRLR